MATQLIHLPASDSNLFFSNTLQEKFGSPAFKIGPDFIHLEWCLATKTLAVYCANGSLIMVTIGAGLHPSDLREAVTWLAEG